MITGKVLLIFGGSGSLGRTLIRRYITKNMVYNFSRDEEKQWRLELDFASQNLKNILGDIADPKRVTEALLSINPHVVIVASAMKHIDRCEADFASSLKSNLQGMINIHDAVLLHSEKLRNLETICFVSTDKACNPISVYGMCKALSEKVCQAIPLKNPSVKCVSVRYGNVVNSRGSILPIIKSRIASGSELTLTDPRMTRFVMTLEESVDLIDYAVCEGRSGETVLRNVPSMSIKDLLEIYCEKYHTSFKETSIRFVEKIHEELINETQSMYTSKNGHYYHIASPFGTGDAKKTTFVLSSDKTLLSKAELKCYLEERDLL